MPVRLQEPLGAPGDVERERLLADAEPKLIGRNIHVMLTPLPANKRKPRFLEETVDEEPEEEGQSPGAGPA
ncbi:MAG: hypothetical protein ACKOTF_11280 [Opitutaceae bacterium]